VCVARRGRRRRGPGGHWGVVLLCLGMAFLPRSIRQRARGFLLDAHGATQRLLGKSAPEVASDASDNQVALLQAELVQVKRSLEAAKGASHVLVADPDVRLVSAEVMPLQGAADFLHRIALDRGQKDGVRDGMPVLAGRVLIGRVAQVSRTTCEVRLVLDPEFRIRASIPRAEGAVEGLLRGTGRGLYFEPAILDERAPAPQPRVGERILCSRASVLCELPALIGVVGKKKRLAGASVPGALVHPLRNPQSLRRVVIVIRQDPA